MLALAGHSLTSVRAEVAKGGRWHHRSGRRCRRSITARARFDCVA